MRLAWAGLYMGPLLAGLAAFGWAAVLPFIAVLTAWSLLSGDQQRLSLADPLSNLGLLWQIAMQAILVILCLSIGRGIGAVLAFTPEFSLILPLGLSLLSLAVLHCAWSSLRGKAHLAAFLSALPSPAKS